MKIQFIISFLLFSTCLAGCIEKDVEEIIDEIDPIIEIEKFTEECIEYDELERCWLTLLPSDYTDNESYPLVVDMHGYTGTNYNMYNYSDWDRISEEHDVIIAYPQGHENSWNAGWCCGVAHDIGIDDVGFILQMVEQISTNFSINDSKIYASGHSNGCAMTQKLANEASHIFAAGGCMALYLLEDADPSFSPTPIIEVHGILDVVIPYSNSHSSSVIFDNSLVGDEGAMKNIATWAEMNGCSGILPEMIEEYPDYSIQGYTNCDENVEVQLVTLHLADHNPYPSANPTGIQTTQMVWDFMDRFTLEPEENDPDSSPE
tara:strand:+ start:1026 stop:1979 length:954 start_codon:yes stop_codon:yes gene_type:complete